MHKKFRFRFGFSCSNNRKSKFEKRPRGPKWVGIFAIALTFAFGGAVANAQQAGKIFRIGFLDNNTAAGSAGLLDVFRRELVNLGWIEGKNITIEYRFTEQKSERLPELAMDLARLKVDLIVVASTAPALAASP